MNANATTGRASATHTRRTRTEVALLRDGLVDIVEAQDRAISLRMLFYLAVSARLIPKTERAYKTIGEHVVVLRQAGAIRWSNIIDGTRSFRLPGGSTTTDVQAILRRAVSTYSLDKTEGQRFTVVVSVEKDTIHSFVAEAINHAGVPAGTMLCRGYPSHTVLHDLARSIVKHGKEVVWLHVGDHDPSGHGLERFAYDRARIYASEIAEELGMSPLLWHELHRVAVTPQQIEGLQLPTRPTKDSDTRAAGFVAEFGRGGCVEVEAMPPRILAATIQEAVTAYFDAETLADVRRREAIGRERLKQLVESAITTFLGESG